MGLAYMGFTQEAGIRCFRFERQSGSPRPLVTPRRTVQYMVLADMSLFARYGIPIQEGPAICRGILAEAIAGVAESELVPASYPVKDGHMASFAAARDALAQAKSARRHRPRISSN